LPLNDRDYMRPNRPQQQPRRAYRPPSLTLDSLLVIIIINVVFYLATLIRPVIEAQLAFSPALIADRPWTLVTAMFIHAGFWHIFLNMLVLFFFGRTLKMFVGDNRFLLVYFAGGIVGNLAFWALNLNTLVFAVGASGAVFAVAGALVVIQPRMRVLFWGIIPMQLWVFVVIFMGMLSVPGLAPSGVAWQAHLGGLATGLVIGWFYRRQLRLFVF